MTSFPGTLPSVTMWTAENLTELVVTIEAGAGSPSLPDLRTATSIELIVTPNRGASDPLALTANTATTAILTISPTTFPNPGTFTAQPIVTWSGGGVSKGSQFEIIIEQAQA